MGVAGVALALLAGSPSVARPLDHVPVYRYYMLTRTDPDAHAIHAALRYEMSHHEAFVIGWVLQTRKGRQDVFDQSWALYYPYADARAGGQGTPGCSDEVVCTADNGDVTTEVHVGFRVWLDYVFVTRDATVSVDLSKSPDKHWKFTELKGDPRVTGQVHVLMPDDGDVTSVSASSWTVQRLKDIGHPGGRYGSIAMGMAPYSRLGLTTTGYAQLDGGQKYTQDLNRIQGEVFYVSGSNRGPTNWRLHGDLVTVGQGGYPTLFVYDLPDPKALRAFLRKS